MSKIDLKLFKIRLQFQKYEEVRVGGRVIEEWNTVFTRWSARRQYTTDQIVSMNANSNQLVGTQQFIVRESLDDAQNPDASMVILNPDNESEQLTIVSLEKDFLNQPFILITVKSGTI